MNPLDSVRQPQKYLRQQPREMRNLPFEDEDDDMPMPTPLVALIWALVAIAAMLLCVIFGGV